MKENKKEQVLGWLLLGITAYGICRLFFMTSGNDIWYDEVFSLGLMKQTMPDIVRLTATDVHPPFYYFYLKWVVTIGTTLFPGLSIVNLAKIASVLPYLGIWIIYATLVRKEWGVLQAGLGSFLSIFMPQLCLYGVEIRMYSLACFLLFATMVGACLYYKTEKNGYLGLVLVCSIGIAYTQYFALLSLGILYCLGGVAFLVEKRWKALLQWGITLGITILAFVPWVPTLVHQMTNVTGSYWIPPLTLRSFAGCLKYMLLPAGGYPKLNVIMAGGLGIAIFLLLLLYGIEQKPKAWFLGEGFVCLLSLGVLAGLVLVGVGFSIVVSPVFVYRYMIPCLTLFWFGIAFLWRRSGRVLLQVILLLLFFAVGYSDLDSAAWEEGDKKSKMELASEGLSVIEDEDILVCNFDHVQAVVGCLLPNKSYLYGAQPETLIRTLYREYKMLESEEQLLEILKQHDTVWFLGSFQWREDLLEEWKTKGILAEETGSYMIERYWFNLYRLSVEPEQ